jgi:hypothetical protein
LPVPGPPHGTRLLPAGAFLRRVRRGRKSGADSGLVLSAWDRILGGMDVAAALPTVSAENLRVPRAEFGRV